MNLKPTITTDRAGDLRMYEPDAFGAMDEFEPTPTGWVLADCISRESFEARRASAYRVFEEVRR